MNFDKGTIELLKSKTFRAASAAIVGAAIGVATKTIDIQSAVEIVFGGVIAITIRHSLAKLGIVSQATDDELIDRFVSQRNSDAKDDSDSSDRRALGLGDRR